MKNNSEIDKNMLLSSSELKEWKNDEMNWWDKFSHLMAKSWEMTPRLNKILRKNMIDDFSNYLYKEDGKLLDVGCGNGWISKIFANEGMNVVGVDFSISQIDEANSLNKNDLGIHNRMTFVCGDITKLETLEIGRDFDSAIVSALLHHLPFQEKQLVLSGISKVLKKGGTIYLYEPVIFDSFKSMYPMYKIIYMFFVRLKALIFKILRYFSQLSPEYKTGEKNGYSGMSPRERAFNYSELLQALPENLEIVTVKPLHGFNIGWGAFQMTLKPFPRFLMSHLTPIVNLIDVTLLNMKYWKSISNDIWVLSGIKIRKK